jgi:hypothetical protein
MIPLQDNKIILPPLLLEKGKGRHLPKMTRKMRMVKEERPGEKELRVDRGKNPGKINQ